MAKSIPEKIRKKIYQESGMACSICKEDDVTSLECHHIQPTSEGGTSTEDNLILLCSSCHSKATYGTIGRSKVLKAKKSLRGRSRSHTDANTPTNVINLQKGINRGIIVNEVSGTIKTTNRTVKMNPPDGAIASSLTCRNYIKHLIDRYHTFKEADVGKKKMKYPIIYGSIKREFGAKWDMISLERFEDLCNFLQRRIDATILGKTLKSRGDKRYSTFAEYCEKHGG